MRRLPLLAACLVLAIASPAVPEEKEGGGNRFSEHEQRILDQAARFERELVRLVADVRPSSVTIENWRTRGKNGPAIKAGAGSGVIISRKGYILTNQHVVQGAKEIWVILEDHRRLKATLVGHDARGDVALLKIPGRGLKAKSHKGAHADRLSPGEWVIATGNPFFLAADGEAVVTLGVVSGLERILPGQFFYGNAIQHDAKINPGNSGGPLWNVRGELLGINGKIATNSAGSARGSPSSSGAGFTIPIDQIRNFIDAMLEGRTLLHGDELLGIQVKPHWDKDGTNDGAEVVKVAPGSPALEARGGGVRPGDVIVQVNLEGKRHIVYTPTDFIAKLSPLAEGDKISLVVVRGYKRIVIPNIVLERKAPPKKGGR